jgi:transposase-like protein
MARTCTICSHEKRDEIDTAFVAGSSYRSIAKQFGCSEAAMYRHVSEHIKQEIKQSKAAIEEARGLDVVQQLKYINEVAVSILQKASKAKDKEWLALQAIDRVCKQLELQAKLLGDIDNQQSDNVDPTLMPYMTNEDIAAINNIVRRAKERKKEAEENITPIRKHA